VALVLIPVVEGLLYCERSGWYSQTSALVPWRWTTMSVGRGVPRDRGDTRSENAMVSQRSLCTKMLEVLVVVWIVTCVACRTLAAAAVPGVMVITLVGLRVGGEWWWGSGCVAEPCL
jgi:hypothetical protein